MPEEYQQTCAECGTTTSIVHRYCPMCGIKIRELEEFETP